MHAANVLWIQWNLYLNREIENYIFIYSNDLFNLTRLSVALIIWYRMIRLSKHSQRLAEIRTGSLSSTSPTRYRLHRLALFYLNRNNTLQLADLRHETDIFFPFWFILTVYFVI
jgi:hypothetical protein